MLTHWLRKAALILIIVLIPVIFFIHQNTIKLSLYHHDKILSNAPSTVISVCMAGCTSGMARYALAQHEAFIKAGIRSILICKDNTFISDTAKKNKLPIITCSAQRFCIGKLAWMPGIEAALKKLVAQYGKDTLAIHCHYKRDVFAAKKIAHKHKIPVVLTHHTPDYLYKTVREEADGIVAVSKSIADDLTALNTQEHVTGHIAAIPPFFDDSRIRLFKPTAQNRDVFFKQQFNVTLQPCPLLIKVAHLYANINHKNHPLLFQAMHELIYKRNTPVQVALAGSGPCLDLYKNMVHDLQLDTYVHFLGNTDLISALLHYADINVLASSKEAFGMVLLEGGFLKKPTIIARGGCGAADWLIIDKETGFLFENKNATDLADKIAYALANPDQAYNCGQRLHEKVMAEFLPDKTVQAMVDFYGELNVTH